LGTIVRRYQDVEFYAPALCREKAIASLALGYTKDMSTLQILERSLSLRMASWGDKDLFVIIDEYCQWLIRNFFKNKSPIIVHSDWDLFAIFQGLDLFRGVLPMLWFESDCPDVLSGSDGTT
jgi:hypothetical protein